MSFSSRPASKRSTEEKPAETQSGLAGLASYGLSIGSSLTSSGYGLFFSSPTPPKSSFENLAPQRKLDKYLEKFKLVTLLDLGRYFSDYISNHGAAPPSAYGVVNAALSFAGGGFIRTNQTYALKAKNILESAAKENTDTGNKYEELCVCKALIALGELHKEMTTAVTSSKGKTSQTIETIFLSMNLNTTPQLYEKELADALNSLEKHYRSSLYFPPSP